MVLMEVLDCDDRDDVREVNIGMIRRIPNVGTCSTR